MLRSQQAGQAVAGGPHGAMPQVAVASFQLVQAARGPIKEDAEGGNFVGGERAVGPFQRHDSQRALVQAEEPFAVAEFILASYLRIVTNGKIFDPPTPMTTATAFCQRLVEWPRAVFVAPSRRHWDLFVELCADINGPLVTDAYVAALAIENGCELVTTDSDFARFKGLRWRHPLGA